MDLIINNADSLFFPDLSLSLSLSKMGWLETHTVCCNSFGGKELSAGTCLLCKPCYRSRQERAPVLHRALAESPAPDLRLLLAAAIQITRLVIGARFTSINDLQVMCA